MNTIPLLHEYLPQEAEALLKFAGFSPETKQELKDKAKTVGMGVLGLAAGTLAGAGVGKLLGAALGRPDHKAIMYMGPLLGAASALSYQQYKKHERRELSK